MDNRKLRYAKRKAKEKILSQRDRAYYRNLNFRENPSLRSTMPRKTQASTEESMRIQSKRRAGNCSFGKKKENGSGKSFENKEDGKKPFLLRKALCISLPKREQACRKTAELPHQA